MAASSVLINNCAEPILVGSSSLSYACRKKSVKFQIIKKIFFASKGLASPTHQPASKSAQLHT